MKEWASVSDLLRAFVRDRVKPGGRYYQRGTNARLAAHLKALGFSEDAAWISTYTDRDADPRRNADVDVAFAICDFFRVTLSDFRLRPEPTATVTAPSAPSLTRYQSRALRLMDRMNERGQRLAVRNIAGFADEFPRTPSPESSQRLPETLSATKHRARGRR